MEDIMAVRREFCEKDNIHITYTDDTVSFEDMTTADAILFKNDGSIIQNNFDEEKTSYFKKYFAQIYQSVVALRNLDGLEIA